MSQTSDESLIDVYAAEVLSNPHSPPSYGATAVIVGRPEPQLYLASEIDETGAPTERLFAISAHSLAGRSRIMGDGEAQWHLFSSEEGMRSAIAQGRTA